MAPAFNSIYVVHMCERSCNVMTPQCHVTILLKINISLDLGKKL